MKKKLIGIISLLFVLTLTISNMSLNNEMKTSDTFVLSNIEVLTSAYAGNPNCKNDPEDTCNVYGTTIYDCDESYWSNNCKEDEPNN